LRRRTRLWLVIAAVTVPLHFFRLSEPRSVVFDEVHYGGFVSAYLGSHAYYFDVHPPHAKLLVAGVAALGGYRGDQDFSAIHTPITAVSPALLRCVPALAGASIPLLLFALLIQLGASDFGALLGGLALALDNALLLETRTLVFEGVLIAATLGALSCYLAALASAGPSRIGWTLAAGALAGLAVGTKLTGLTALAMIGVCGTAAGLRDRSAAALRALVCDSAVIALAALAVYAFGWWLHFSLLTQPGPGDRWGAPTGDWLADTLSVQRRMWSANVGLSAKHAYASPWWSWPLMLRAISFWSSGGSSLALLGNPVVWWGSALGLGGLLATRPLRAWPRELWVPLWGWAIAYLPLIGVTRVLFLYHYLTPLVFSVGAVALWLDHSGWTTRSGGWRDQPRRFWIVLAGLVIGFASISPFTLSYLHAPAYQQALFRAMPGWR
jgi:dolichyl-phosphate-mannose-protein mannosyltransferase